MTDVLPVWFLWALLASFTLVALCALVADIRRKRDTRWQRVLGVRMQQEAANEDE